MILHRTLAGRLCTVGPATDIIRRLAGIADKAACDLVGELFSISCKLSPLQLLMRLLEDVSTQLTQGMRMGLHCYLANRLLQRRVGMRGFEIALGARSIAAFAAQTEARRASLTFLGTFDFGLHTCLLPMTLAKDMTFWVLLPDPPSNQ